MIRLVVKQALFRRGRLALTVVAVLAGVAFVVGSLVLTDTSHRVYDDQFATAASGVDVTVRDAAAFDSAMGVEVERDPLPSSLADRVAAVRGVRTVQPVVRGSGLLVDGTDAIVPRGPSMLSSWVPRGLTGFRLHSGHAPGDGEVVVDRATARAHGLRVGDRVTVQSERSARLRITGTVRFGDQDGMPNTTVALVSMRQAQRLTGLGDRVSELLVVGDPDVPSTVLRDRLGNELGTTVDVGASRDTAEASARAAKDQLEYLQVTLVVLAAAALLIGCFLIANTFSIVVAQRTRELALLRAAGATGRQVLWSVVGEAAVVGLVGSVLGSAAGVVVARGLRLLARGVGIALPEAPLVVLPRTLLVGLAVGMVVTVLAAVAPARRAARTAPVEAMRTGDTVGDPTRDGARRRTAARLLVASPLLALARWVGRPLRLLGVPGHLASLSVARAPRRTTATVTALALSLGLIVFTGVLASSVKASIRSTYAEVVTADYVVESARGEMLGGLVPAAYRQARDVPEVATVSRLRYGHWKDGDVTRALTAVDPGTLRRVAHVDMVAGRLGALGSGGIVLSEKAAADHGVGVGDRLAMTFAKGGEQRLRVVGLVQDADAQVLGTDYLVSLRSYARLFSERMDASLLVKVADGVAPAQARHALRVALADLPTAEVRDQRAAVEGRTAAIDQVLGLVTVLLGFTVLIALLGITNTLALSIVERTREIGLLRAVGMTRRQLRTMVRAEAVLVAALALVLAVLLGLGAGAATVAVMGRSTPLSLSVPAAQLGLVLLLATGCGVLGGLLPARRAARTDVLTAIAAQ